eukprot:1863090-Alexandrium_andersonii.AAC.1
MSASLVGSEMCIRDSFSSRPPGWYGLPGGREEKWLLGPGALLRVVATAVSYTHLTLPTICSV